jgi:hypothetical protein
MFGEMQPFVRLHHEPIDLDAPRRHPLAAGAKAVPQDRELAPSSWHSACTSFKRNARWQRSA